MADSHVTNVTPTVQVPAKIIWRTRFWTAFHTIVLMCLLLLLMQDNYECHVYSRLVEKVVRPGMDRDQTAAALTYEIYQRLNRRREIWSGYDGGIRTLLFNAADAELLAPEGACGSASFVLARALQAADYKVRFVQMKVGEVWGGHIMLEAEVEPGRWAVLGPTFGVTFKRPDGKLASFADVHNDWPYYVSQTPPRYPLVIDFQDVRYTNWDKIPIVMPLLRNILTFIMGKEWVRTLSIRSYFTQIYRLDTLILAVSYLVILAVRTMYRWRRRRRDTSFTAERTSDMMSAGANRHDSRRSERKTIALTRANPRPRSPILRPG